MDSFKSASKIIKILEEKKIEDLTLYDVKDYSSISDFVIVCSASNTVATRAVSSWLEDKMKDNNQLIRMDGKRGGEWIVLDFGDVIVHIFTPEARAFYNLDKLFSENGKKIDRRE